MMSFRSGIAMPSVRLASLLLGLAGLLLLSATMPGWADSAKASGIASPGFAVSGFAIDFSTGNRFGPMGLAFDSHGKLFAIDNTDNNLYAFSAARPGGHRNLHARRWPRNRRLRDAAPP